MAQRDRSRAVVGLKRAGPAILRLTRVALLVAVVTMAAVACGRSSTPPGASKAMGSAERGGYLFLRWQEGLEVMIWHNLTGEGSGHSAGSGCESPIAAWRRVGAAAGGRG